MMFVLVDLFFLDKNKYAKIYFIIYIFPVPAKMNTILKVLLCIKQIPLKIDKLCTIIKKYEFFKSFTNINYFNILYYNVLCKWISLDYFITFNMLTHNFIIKVEMPRVIYYLAKQTSHSNLFNKFLMKIEFSLLLHACNFQVCMHKHIVHMKRLLSNI